MEPALSFDTTYLIDFQRERLRETHGPCHLLAERFGQAEFLLSSIALGEFAAGFPDPEDPLLSATRRLFKVLPVTDLTALSYRDVYRTLKDQGRLIGANDLWIAAAALEHNVPLVTRNADEFARVTGLAVLGY